MSKKRKYYLIALILWAGLIFFFSSRPGYVSDTDSEVLIEKFAEVQKTVNESNVGITMKYSPIFIVRKTAHIILYGVLTFLFFNVYYKEDYKLFKPFIFSIISSVLYALSDELHQHFVPGRSGMLWDVQIDSYGIIGVAVLTLISYKIMKNKKLALESNIYNVS